MHDYELLFQEIQERDLTREDLMRLTGCSYAALGNIIDSFSLRYPIYEVSPGTFALLKPENPDTIRCQ
jgi:hypothetical protein